MSLTFSAFLSANVLITSCKSTFRAMSRSSDSTAKSLSHCGPHEIFYEVEIAEGSFCTRNSVVLFIVLCIVLVFCCCCFWAFYVD